MSEVEIQKVREATKHGVLVGLAGVSGVRPRLDIDVYLNEDPRGFILFIRAMDRLQKRPWNPEKEFTSFYELAGIHGLPNRPWHGVTKPNPFDVGEGYCPHGVITFAPWHRPYIALLEQALFIEMIDLASEWKDPALKAEYHKAAIEFRLPYWDYFRPRSYDADGFTFPGVIQNDITSYPYDFKAPLVFTSKTLLIRQPSDDVPTEMDNPLYSYKFPAEMQVSIDELKVDETEYPRTATVRYPTATGKPGLDSVGTMNAVLNGLRMDSNRQAIHMMAKPEDSNPYKRFELFGYSTGRTVPDSSVPLPERKLDSVIYANEQASGSLEDIHNMYHGLIGGGAAGDPGSNPFKNAGTGGGHMSVVTLAAFDPIFWFHHNQIERLFTIWQKIHDGESTDWFGDEAELPLSPFYKYHTTVDSKDPEMWSSNDVRGTEVLGYNFQDAAGSGATVAEHFASLYSWSIYTDREKRLPVPKAPASMEPIKVEETEFIPPTIPKTSDGSKISIARVPKLAKAAAVSAVTTSQQVKKPRDWFVDTRVTRLAFNGPFMIYFFITNDDKQVPPNGVRFLTEPTLAAVQHIFTSSREDCVNCKNQESEGKVVSGTNAVTSMLLDYAAIGQLQSLEPEHVEPFLTERLRWRVVTLDGRIRDVRTLASEQTFKVGLSSKYVDDNGQKVYGNHYKVIEDIVMSASPTADNS